MSHVNYVDLEKWSNKNVSTCVCLCVRKRERRVGQVIWSRGRHDFGIDEAKIGIFIEVLLYALILGLSAKWNSANIGVYNKRKYINVSFNTSNEHIRAFVSPKIKLNYRVSISCVPEFPNSFNWLKKDERSNPVEICKNDGLKCISIWRSRF